VKLDAVDFQLVDRPEFNSNLRSAAQHAPVQDFIDEHLFIEALALAAFEVVYREPQPSNIEKVSKPSLTDFPLQIILLMERMNHSEGPLKIQLAYGVTRFGQNGETSSDITALLRSTYPSYFMPQALSPSDFQLTAETQQTSSSHNPYMGTPFKFQDAPDKLSQMPRRGLSKPIDFDGVLFSAETEIAAATATAMKGSASEP